ncbi:hypothetical protein H8356DRAFT_1353313 [Neocallimastix lanati (nom. inval.)]|nr:hypothetical protein H8356DRAFT_1353313 [Neocallimastix sp. JGI-2020a]
MNLNIKIGGDIGEYKKNNRIKYNIKINDHNSGQPESAEPEGFSNLKKVNNILVYCGKEQVPDVILNEELLMQSITELKDKIKKIIFEEDNFIQITKKKKILSKKINKLNCEIESLKLEEKEDLKFIVEVTSEDIEATE